MAIGLLHGNDNADSTVVNTKTKNFIQRFKEKNGAVRCMDIIGFDVNNVNAGDIKGIFKFLIHGGPKMCKGVVGSAVQLLMENQPD